MKTAILDEIVVNYKLFKSIFIPTILFLGLLTFWLITRTSFNNKQVVIGFTGDVMLGRLVNQALGRYGYEYVWGDLLSDLAHDDLTIINLETTLTKSTNPVPKVFNFKADPDKVQALKSGSIDIVNLANNHILDYGYEGLFDTLHALDTVALRYIGAGKNIMAARKPLVLIKNGLRIGIIGCTDNEPAWKAGNNKPGTNYISTIDYAELLKDIDALRKEVDILIVTMHWGPNYPERPTQEFIDFAHILIESGVTIFHGHSAHIVQGIELYKNGLILYNTGDFVDDYAVDPKLRNDLSFLFQVTVTKNGVQAVSLIPVRIKEMQVNKAVGSDYQFITKRMQQLSQEFGVILQEKNNRLQLLT